MTGKITSTQVAPAAPVETVEEVAPETTTVKKATPKRATKKAAGKKATPKAATKKGAAKKAPKTTKKAAGKKTPAANKKAAKKAPAAAGANKIKGKDPLRGKRLPIMKTMLKMGATSGITAKPAAEIAAKAGEGIEEKDVQHYCYKTMDLMQSGLVAQAELEGVRKLCYHLTAAGKKAVEAAK